MTALAVMGFGWLAAPSAEAAGAVLVGAGDIAQCNSSGDSATARLLASIGGTVFTLGDNAYEEGTARDFRACFGPTAKVGCRKGSEQERWLRAELARHSNKCTLAYFHHPRFSSDDNHGNAGEVAPFWEALYDHGADLVLSGHAHSYERFAPQTPWGKHDPTNGIRQIVVGTGGAPLYGMGSTRPNSQVRNANTLGVLKLNLSSDSYRWSFIPQAGKWFRDSGHGKCHGRP